MWRSERGEFPPLEFSRLNPLPKSPNGLKRAQWVEEGLRRSPALASKEPIDSEDRRFPDLHIGVCRIEGDPAGLPIAKSSFMGEILDA